MRDNAIFIKEGFFSTPFSSITVPPQAHKPRHITRANSKQIIFFILSPLLSTGGKNNAAEHNTDKN